MELRFLARLEKFKDSLLSLEKINHIEWPAVALFLNFASHLTFPIN